METRGYPLSGMNFTAFRAGATGGPVVATPLAAEGLAAEHGQNCLIAENPVNFSTCVTNLLDSEGEMHRIGMRGRGTFEYQYNWEVVWKNLGAALQVRDSEVLKRYTE